MVIVDEYDEAATVMLLMVLSSREKPHLDRYVHGNLLELL